MKSETAADHPLRDVFDARQAFDATRRGTYRALSAWTSGSVAFDEVRASMNALDQAHRDFATAVEAASEYRPEIQAIPGRRFVVRRRNEG